VRALVSLIEDDLGGYRLAVELHAKLPGIDRAQANASWTSTQDLPLFQSIARRHIRQAAGGLSRYSSAANVRMPEIFMPNKTLPLNRQSLASR